MTVLVDINPQALPRPFGEVRRAEPLARHSRWRVGGPAGRLKRRAAIQPTRLRTLGPVFHDSPGDHGARLIEAAGLKGRRLGGAEVSLKHANFLINTGAARARDMASLIDRVPAEFERANGTRLITAARRVGELSR
jgi:UDP-N-acetylenolpyruvoylglucosamine reductase